MTESAQQVWEREMREAGERPERRARSPLLPVGVMVLVAAGFFALSLAQSLTRPWNSDTASVALQGWDMVHGHLLLHGWWSSDVNFYTFDAPIYGLCALVLGLSGFSLHVAGALIYTLVFLAACWLAKGGAEGAVVRLRVALVALFMTADLFSGGGLLQTIMIVPDHNGTIVFVFVAYVVYTRFAERRWAPWAMLALLMLGQLGDVTVRYVAVPAILFVWAVEHLRRWRLRTPETWLALAAIVSVPAATELRSLMKAMGAYYLTKAHTDVAPLSQAGWHFTGMWQSLFGMFGVDVHNFPGGSVSRVGLTCVGGFALACGLLSLLRVLIRWTRVDDADRLLAVTVLVYLAAYEFSTVASPGDGGGYEFVGVVAMLAVLSARAAASLRPLRLPSFQRAGLTVAALGAVATLLSGTALFRPTNPDPVEPVAAWLEQHGLTYGLAGYWNASPITVYTGGKVQVRPIYLKADGGFVPRAWGARAQWYDAKTNDARFVVAEQDPRGDMTKAQVEKALGSPSAQYTVNGYSVLVYSYNLLTKGSAPGLPAGA
ncbi:MAG TPA: hypothetical protein VFN97_01790 [Actinospica sp.]|nr:hypothetical protein [Actinospica sp.]